jgi:hypothetical protein
MSIELELANRLRQAVQGCTVHTHGPIQAWLVIDQAARKGELAKKDIAKIVIQMCDDRIKELKLTGLKGSNIAIQKEIDTKKFIQELFTGYLEKTC